MGLLLHELLAVLDDDTLVVVAHLLTSEVEHAVVCRLLVNYSIADAVGTLNQTVDLEVTLHTGVGREEESGRTESEVVVVISCLGELDSGITAFNVDRSEYVLVNLRCRSNAGRCGAEIFVAGSVVTDIPV